MDVTWWPSSADPPLTEEDRLRSAIDKLENELKIKSDIIMAQFAMLESQRRHIVLTNVRYAEARIARAHIRDARVAHDTRVVRERAQSKKVRSATPLKEDVNPFAALCDV